MIATATKKTTIVANSVAPQTIATFFQIGRDVPWKNEHAFIPLYAIAMPNNERTTFLPPDSSTMPNRDANPRKNTRTEKKSIAHANVRLLLRGRKYPATKYSPPSNKLSNCCPVFQIKKAIKTKLIAAIEYHHVRTSDSACIASSCVRMGANSRRCHPFFISPSLWRIIHRVSCGEASRKMSLSLTINQVPRSKPLELLRFIRGVEVL